MLRVAGSLVTSKVRACDLIRMISRDGNPIPDESYRRRVTRQLDIQESRHRLARKIFHGQRGELRQAYREGQEDQLGALGLVLNAVVLWNTRYVDAAVTALRSAGHLVTDADAARLPAGAGAHQPAGPLRLPPAQCEHGAAGAARPRRGRPTLTR
jgi:Tn3 transposase DDE domain